MLISEALGGGPVEVGTDEYLLLKDPLAAGIIAKIKAASKTVTMRIFNAVSRHFTLLEQPDHANSRRAFNGTIPRYSFDAEKLAFIRLDESLA